MELPDLKWATLMFFLSSGIFPLGFYSVCPSDQYPLNPSVWLHWGHRPTLGSSSTGKALILFPSQSSDPDMGLWLVQSSCRLQQVQLQVPLPWHLSRVKNLWALEETASCGPDKGLHTCTGHQTFRLWESHMALPMATAAGLKGCPHCGL